MAAPRTASPAKGSPDELLLDELLLDELLLDELLLDEPLLDELLLDELFDELLLDELLPEDVGSSPPQAASNVLSIPITSILRIIVVAPHLALAMALLLYERSGRFFGKFPVNDSKEIASR